MLYGRGAWWARMRPPVGLPLRVHDRSGDGGGVGRYERKGETQMGRKLENLTVVELHEELLKLVPRYRDASQERDFRKIARVRKRSRDIGAQIGEQMLLEESHRQYMEWFNARVRKLRVLRSDGATQREAQAALDMIESLSVDEDGRGTA